jgi:hypothetical protein
MQGSNVQRQKTEIQRPKATVMVSGVGDRKKHKNIRRPIKNMLAEGTLLGAHDSSVFYSVQSNWRHSRFGNEVPVFENT